MLCPDWQLEGPLLALWPYRIDVWREHARPIQTQLTDFLLQVQVHHPVLVGVHPRELVRARRFLPMSIPLVPIRYNDAWPRDIGPIWTHSAAGFCAHDFRFSAWHGLYPNSHDDQRFVRDLCAHFGWQRRTHPQVLEGGALSTNGTGIVCWSRRSIERNNGISKASLMTKQRLQQSFESVIVGQQHLWFETAHAADETGGHIDNIAQFLAPDILAIDADMSATEARTLQQLPSNIQLVELPPTTTIQPLRQDFGTVQRRRGVMPRGIQPLLASYINFVRTPTAVFVPQFGLTTDAEAVRRIKSALPQLTTVPVAANEMIAGGGGPHCLTLPLPALTRY
ncbi:MAG TPA: agmatine deiminase family protein [Pseudidiomarina sp.]|nr:agmatine deiminase family protein [Pseudidiomarina sp.]